MGEYFEYLGLLLKRIFEDIGAWFTATWAVPRYNVPSNFDYYNSLFNQYSPSFGAGGWVFFVLFIILFAALIAGIFYLLFILIRRYVRFARKELDKQKLQDQVERLNYELFNAIEEKDKILNLKVGQLGVGIPKAEDKKKAQDVIEEVSSRFPKLTYVDHEYANIDTSIPEVANLTLEEVCNSFRQFAASQLHLYYTIDTIRELFAGMATSKLIILEGISGTGKTSLPYALGKFFNHDAAICSVQPSRKDRSELLGYYNEFTKKFNETEFLKVLYIATYRKDINIIVLDEMNLARIEYYFAEFLSVMEMPNINEWNIELINSFTKDDPKHLKEGKLLIPQNVEFFGTANNDDSTFTISDKVYDRAISIFFDNKGIAFDAEFSDQLIVSYDQLNKLFQDAANQYPISDKLLEKFDKLDVFVIQKFKLAFGNRILKQLKTFIPVYVACGGTELGGLDFIFTNKVLKKFESLNVAFLRDEMKQLEAELDKLYGKGTFPMAHKYLENLIKMNM
jgi:hypothetical protein